MKCSLFSSFAPAGLVAVALLTATSAAVANGTHLLGSEDALEPCPETPNCVSSLADEADEQHYIAPLDAASPEVLAFLTEALTETEGYELVESGEDYANFEFTTRLFRFVDDVDFFYDAESSLIHVRSASRVGVSDLGANRKRVEEIRTLLQATQ